MNQQRLQQKKIKPPSKQSQTWMLNASTKPLKNKTSQHAGTHPITALITYAKDTKVKEAQVLNYNNSGDITGDPSSVVGYAAVSFKK